MRRKKYEIRKFLCSECGMINYAAKEAGKMTKKGHIKDLYCPSCEKVTKHIQDPRFWEV